jgi:hypothetical protein
MNRKLSVVCLSVLLVAGTILVVGAGKPIQDANATSTIQDTDTTSGLPFRIGSDGLGVYKQGVNSVASVIQGIGDWELDTKTSSLRRVRIDFGDPVIGSGANPPFQSAMVPTRFISKCASWNIFMPGMLVGQQADCPLALSITYDGTTYAVRTNENYAGTEPARWTCLARNSTKCVSWQMVPSVVQGDGQQKIRMQLIRIPARTRDPEVLLGQFYMSFKIDVTTP